MNRLKMSRKGTVTNILVILLMVAALTYFLLNNLESKREGEFKAIGTKQLKLIRYYNDAELNLIFYDKIGMFMLPRALYKLGASGGFYGVSPCGTVGNYNLWSYKDSECKPDYRGGLGRHLQESFNMYYPLMPEDTKPERESFLFYSRGSDSVVVDAIPLGEIKVGYLTGEEDPITYSVKPSFKMYAPYEISSYETFYQKSMAMQEQCINKRYYQSCVEERLVHMNAETPNVDWSRDCNRGNEKVFYTFFENYKDCLTTLDDDCICSFSMDFREDSDAEVEGTYSIKVYGNGTMVMDGLKADLNADILFGKSPMTMGSVDYATYFVKYNSDGSIDRQKILENSDSYNAARDYSKIMIYKDFIHEYNTETHFGIVETESGEIACRVYPRTAKICATDKMNTYMFYDEDSVVDEKISIKFAMYFNDIFPPAPITGLKINDKVRDEGAVIISFNRSKDEDIYQYKVFNSDTDFTSVEGMTPVEIIYDDGISSDIYSFEFAVEEDAKDYYFAITTVDVFNNENRSVVAVVGRSVDDLAPEGSEISFMSVSGEGADELEILDLATGAVWGSDGIKGFFNSKAQTTRTGSYSKFSGSNDLLTIPIDCSGYGLPNQNFINAYENNEAWNSGGIRLREATELQALQYRVHPALIAAHETMESGMGTDNKCTTMSKKSALTGCSWPGGTCADGCANPSNCDSDMSQIRCTANVDSRAYEAAMGGRGYSVYGNCNKYSGEQEKLWNCVLCTYVHGFKDEQQCDYNSKMKESYCKWYNYYSRGVQP